MLKPKLWHTAALTSLLLIGACGGNQEDKVAKRLERIADSWTAARQIDSPSKRLKAYDSVLADLDTVADKYAETSLGRSIAVGRSIGRVSPQEIRAARDRLAPRVDCYEKPDIACLSEFTSIEYTSGEPSNDPAITARAQVCS